MQVVSGLLYMGTGIAAAARQEAVRCETNTIRHYSEG